MKAKETEKLGAQRKGWIYLLLTALCFLIYANSLNNAFISDDIPAIVNNPAVGNLFSFWLDPATLLNSLNYHIGGLNPFGYHLTNIILHSLNTILVFLFLSLFFKTGASLLGACLFAVHPVHAEAVTWVSGKPYIITSIFILMGYLLYNNFITAEDNKRTAIRNYVVCLAVFFYYLIANVSFYFIFPFFLLLSYITFKRWRKHWKFWFSWSLFLGILILRLFFAKALIIQRVSAVAHDVGVRATWTNPIFNLAYSFFSHMGLLIWPAKLTLYHEPAVISSAALNVALFFLFLLAIISIFFLFNKAKELFFGIGIFVLFLAPTYSPVMVSWLVAERYLYFPSIILSIFLAFFYERVFAESKKFAKPALAVAIFVIAGLAVRTVARNEDWKTPERFWRQTVLISYNSPRSHNNMGDVYATEGNTEGAIREFKKALELKPDYADVCHNLANIYSHEGDLDEAVKFYKQAISFNPDLFESHYNLGVIYLNKRELDSAKEQFREALKIRPDNENARQALDMAMEK